MDLMQEEQQMADTKKTSPTQTSRKEVSAGKEPEIKQRTSFGIKNGKIATL